MDLNGILQVLLDIIYPPRCLLCGRYEGEGRWRGICEDCTSRIRYILSPLCCQCGKPFYSEGGEDHLCGECLTQKRYFTRARAMGYYDGVLREAIHLLKYTLKRKLASFLGNLLATHMYSFLREVSYQVIIPVPLHPSRLRERGFNQALLIARVVADRIQVPVDPFSLVRIRKTKPQVALREQERRDNVRGAFLLSRVHRVVKKTILLVDDVYTSGSTLEECARVLLKGGAIRVDVLTLARVA